MKYKQRPTQQKINDTIELLKQFSIKNDYKITITKNTNKMETKNKNNTAVLFKNENKANENHPDYKGTITIDNVEKKLVAWVKTSKNGLKYLSLTINEPQDKKEEVKPIEPHTTQDLF